MSKLSGGSGPSSNSVKRYPSKPSCLPAPPQTHAEFWPDDDLHTHESKGSASTPTARLACSLASSLACVRSRGCFNFACPGKPRGALDSDASFECRSCALPPSSALSSSSVPAPGGGRVRVIPIQAGMSAADHFLDQFPRTNFSTEVGPCVSTPAHRPGAACRLACRLGPSLRSLHRLHSHPPDPPPPASRLRFPVKY